jgi:hypothetical protein
MIKGFGARLLVLVLTILKSQCLSLILYTNLARVLNFQNFCKAMTPTLNVCVHYCSTYYKAVRLGGGKQSSGGHVLRETRFLYAFKACVSLPTLGFCRRAVYAPKRNRRPLWRGPGGGGVLAGTRRPSAAGDGVPPSLQIPPHTHILLARSPAPYSPFRRRAHSPTAFSGPMARPPPSPPRHPPSHMHAGWMVSATNTPTSSAPSQDRPF